MSPYITYKDTNKNGDLCLYILQREFPHYQGVICYLPIHDSICCIPIAGHNLYLAFAGTIRGNYIMSNPEYEKQVGLIFESMAAWFYENRIRTDPKRYKKWAIHP